MTSPSVKPKSYGLQLASIVSVNLITMKAVGYTRQQGNVDIDFRYHVGGVHVTPAVGEQWRIQRFGMNWVLQNKLPTNTTDLLTDPVQGQVQIGSTGTVQGPLQLNGSQVSVNAPLGVLAVSTADRPAASSLPAGSHIYDTTLSKPIWTNGTNWTDATGEVV